MDHKKDRFIRGVEIATNLAITLVALIGATVLVKNYLLRPTVQPVSEVKPAVQPSSGAASRPAPLQGTKLSVPDIDWATSDQTVLLALSNKCHFCTESAPFYQRLASELAQRKDVRLVAVFPQEIAEAKKYLDGLGVPIQEVKKMTLASLNVRGTPTLLIVDKTGVVKQVWVGRLSSEIESQVLNHFKV